MKTSALRKVSSALFVLLRVHEHVSATSRYLKTSKSKNGSGLSSKDPYNNAKEAIAALRPGDTLYLMGSITNPSYDPNYSFSGDVDDPQLWHSEKTLQLSKVIGTSDAPITITSYDDDTTVKGNGNGGSIILVNDCEYIIIEGLNVRGEVKNIPIETAKALQFVYRDEDSDETKYPIQEGLRNMVNEMARDEKIKDLELDPLGNVDRPSYTSTRGIYVAKSYHITISNCRVHYTPGGGIRAAYTEYMNIINNEVHDTSRKSFSGTHALVVVTYTSDDRDKNKNGQARYRARIMGNLVHNNYNEMGPFFPSWPAFYTKWTGWRLEVSTLWNS